MLEKNDIVRVYSCSLNLAIQLKNKVLIKATF